MRSASRNEKYFWRHRAGAYPLPFDPAVLKKTKRLIRAAGALGAGFRGRTVLDIGCGTGIYALVLAKQAPRTLGIDSSGLMLERFRSEARERGIKNAGTLRADWAGVPRRLIAKKFDIALASMTHAVINAAGLAKMEAAARELCVYIGWAGVRRNALWEKVYAHHGLKYLPPGGAEEIIPLLKKTGRKYRTAYLMDSWRRSGTPAEILKDMEVSLKVNNARPDRAWLKKLIKGRTRNGRVSHTTVARKGLIVWRPRP